MKILFYTTICLPPQMWANNYDETKRKENLQINVGVIEKSNHSKNGDLVHFVSYENGTILVLDSDKIN